MRGSTFLLEPSSFDLRNAGKISYLFFLFFPLSSFSPTFFLLLFLSDFSFSSMFLLSSFSPPFHSTELVPKERKFAPPPPPPLSSLLLPPHTCLICIFSLISFLFFSFFLLVFLLPFLSFFFLGLIPPNYLLFAPL